MQDNLKQSEAHAAQVERLILSVGARPSSLVYERAARVMLSN
jgi:hypothetical protein